MNNSESELGRRWGHWAAVVAGYAALSLVATWPLVLHFDTDSPGSDSWGDRRIYFETPTNLWNLWWFRHALVDLGESPFQCRHVFYPYGANLWFHSLSPVRGLLGVVLQTILTLPATLNLILLMDLVAAGSFAYLAARRLGVMAGGAFLAGAIYAFSPGSFAHLYAGNFEQLSTFWMPAALWLFLRLVQSAGPWWKDGVALGLVLVGAAYTCHYYVIFAVELLAVAIAVCFRRATRANVLQGLSVAGVLALLGMSPLLHAFLSSRGARPDVSWAPEFDLYSADLVSYFVPSFMNALLAAPLETVHGHLNPNANYLPQENTAFLGYFVLALAICGFVLRRRSREPVALPVAIMVTFLLLSLGAHLKIYGHNTGFPLPAAVLTKFPLLNLARAPGRHILVAMLGLGMLAGWGWQGLRHGWLRWTLLPVLALEFSPIPLPLFSAELPEVYGKLRDAPGKFAVLEIPLGMRDGTVLLGDADATQLFAQSVHGRPVVTGVVGRVPRARWQLILTSPVIGTLLQPESPDKWERNLEFDKQRGPAFFAQWRIKVIVIHPAAKNGPEHHYVAQVFPVSRKESFSDGTELLWLE